MNERYAVGAHVVSLDGVDLGPVTAVDDEGLEIRLDQSGEVMRVPFEVIDEDASTEEVIVVHGAVTAGLNEVRHADLGSVAEVGEHQTLALVGEEAIANVREVDRGKVLVHKRVETMPHEAQVEVGTDRVEVERVPVNEEFDTAPGTRQEGDTLIVPVVEEVLVVSKRYRVVEEVHVRKIRDVQTEILQEELRREVVEIEELDETGQPRQH
jgi:uncharacterized protein (TIGR02271 family)